MLVPVSVPVPPVLVPSFWFRETETGVNQTGVNQKSRGAPNNAKSNFALLFASHRLAIPCNPDSIFLAHGTLPFPTAADYS